MAKKSLKPKIQSGGKAIPLGKNYYYMKGRKHEQGGIDIGADPKSGLEVEDGEVMHLSGSICDFLPTKKGRCSQYFL